MQYDEDNHVANCKLKWWKYNEVCDLYSVLIINSERSVSGQILKLFLFAHFQFKMMNMKTD